VFTTLKSYARLLLFVIIYMTFLGKKIGFYVIIFLIQKMTVPMAKRIKSCKFFNIKTTIFIAFILSIFSFAGIASAVLYPPGATLNPGCLPTDSNCDVQLEFYTNGPLSGTGASTSPLTILQASSMSGYLSATDWNIFNDKLSSTSLEDTYPTFTYASNTFATLNSLNLYLSTTSAFANYLSTSTASSTYLKISDALSTYLLSSASTSLAYISLASSSLYYLVSNPAGYITGTSTAFIPSASSSLYLLNSASTSLAYIPFASSSLYYLNSNPAGYISTTSIAANYISTSTASSTYLSIATATSSYMTFGYASSTYASTTWVSATFIPLSASTSLSYISLASSSLYYLASNPAGYISTTSIANNYISTSTFSNTLLTYLSTTSASLIYPSFAYASSTYMPLASSSLFLLNSASTSLSYIPLASSSLYYLVTNPNGYIATETDPIWMAASSSYLTIASASTNYISTSTFSNTLLGYLSTTSVSQNYISTSTASSTYLKIADASSTYLQLSASTSLSYIPLSASTSLAYIPAASSSLYLLNSASTSLAYIPFASSSLYYLNSNPFGYISSSSLTPYMTFTYASSTYIPLASSSLFATGTNDWSINGSSIYNNNGGFVGIGTSSPSTLLQVGSSTYSGVGIGDLLRVSKSANPYLSASANGKQMYFGYDTTDDYGRINAHDYFGGDAMDILIGNSETQGIMLKGNGRLGIDTIAPSQALDVNGNIRIRDALFDGTNASGTSGMILTSTGLSTAWIASTSLAYIPLASSSLYYLATNPAGYLSTTSIAADYVSTSSLISTLNSYLTTASSTATYLTISNASTTYLSLSASTSLSYIPLASSSLFYLATNPAGYISTTSLAADYISTSSLASTLISYLTTASSTATYLTISNASTTYLSLSASTSLSYIPAASSSLYLLNSASTSLAYVPIASSSLYLLNSASTSLPYLLYSSSTEVLNKAYFAPVFVSTGVTVDPNLMVGYKFEPSSSLADYSNNADTGVAVGTNTYYSSGGPDNNGGYYYIPMNSYVRTTNNFSLGTSYTISFWYKPPDTGFNGVNYRTIEFGSYVNGWSIQNMDLIINGQNNINTGYTPAVGQWHYYTYTVDGATKLVSFYIDGVFYKSATYTTNIDATARELSVNSQVECQCWSAGGYYDDVFIYNRKESATNVATDFAAGGYSYGAVTGYVRPVISTDTNGNFYLSSIGGKVGIGTTTPSAVLDVYADNPSSSDIFGVSSSSGSRLFTITSAGKVGIGTSTPSTALYVIGTSTTQGLNISSLSSGLLTVDSTGNVSTVPTNTYAQLQTQPLSVFSNLPAQSVLASTTAITGLSDYGTFDGKYIWAGSFANYTITKIDQNANIVATYTLNSQIAPLQLAYDGRYIWVGSGDGDGYLDKFDPTTGTSTYYEMNPSGLGAGGVQGVMWDGNNIWIAISQNGGGAGSGIVEKLDSNGNVLASTTGQTNVNGLAYTYINGVEYVYAACNGFLTKIKTTNMSTTTTATAVSPMYRIATDGQYIYGVAFASGANLEKFDANTLAQVASYNSGANLNSVAYDGKYIWVAGNDNTVTINDKDSGAIVKTIPNGGKSDLIFDGQNMWSISSGDHTVKKLSDNFKNTYVDTTFTPSLIVSNNIGIGTSTPGYALTIVANATTSTTGQIQIMQSATSSYWTIGSVASSSGSGNEFAILNQGALGEYIVNGASAWTSKSDQRLKTNVNTLGSSTLDEILSLNPVTFNWIATSSSQAEQVGFIAQEVEAAGLGDIVVVPQNPNDCIPGDPNNSDCYGLDYDRFAPYLVKAIQEQQVLIDINSSTTEAMGDISTSTSGLISLVNQIQSENARDAIAVIDQKISEGSAMLTDFIAARVTAIRGYFDEIFANKVHTKEICVSKNDGSEICVNGDELQNMVNQTGTVLNTGSGKQTYDFSSASTSATSTSSTSSDQTSISTSIISTDSTATTTQATSTNSVSTSTPDTSPPVITINGDNPTNITAGDTYTDAGATATDNIDGTVPVLTSGTVDSTTAGTYTITYKASDSSGNMATATRIVNVAPVQTSEDSATSSDATTGE
jgi:hypothetical protein